GISREITTKGTAVANGPATPSAGVNFSMGQSGNVTGNFVGNTISNNSAQGLNFVMGTNPTVTNGSLLSNTISGNTISGNGAEGISITLANAGRFGGVTAGTA